LTAKARPWYRLRAPRDGRKGGEIMKKNALSRWRVRSWLVPVVLLAMSLMLQACGDDDGCGDIDTQSNETSCGRWALQHDCGVTDYTFDTDTNVCSLSTCRVCPTFTPVRAGTPSPGPTNTPVKFPPGYTCDVNLTINTPRPTPGVTPNIEALCQVQATNRVCGSPNFSFEESTGVCQVFGCGICDFPSDVY
jgi:hypothetical protein